MLRLLWAILIGVLVGGAAAALSIKVLGVAVLGGLVAYPLAVVVGLLVGLVAGKPIWAEGARIEAGLKAVFGALLAAGLMFALRKWATFDLNLTSFGLAQGQFGQLAALALPTIATVLAMLFEVDNMFGKSSGDDDSKKRVGKTEGSSKARIGKTNGEDAEAEAGSDGSTSRTAKR